MNPVLESLFKHQSIRKYKDQPLEDEKLNLIIKAAQAAPNWCNAQHVSIIAVKDTARKQKLAELSLNLKFIGTCPVFLVFCADFYRTAYAFEKNGKSEQFTKDYIEQLDTLLVASHEAGIAMENAIVAAESMGLGTVPIGLIRTNPLEVVKELNLPKYVLPMIGLCIGYPDENPGVKPRLPMEGVLFEEKYDTEKCKANVDIYDEQFKKYVSQRSTNSREETWSENLANKYSQFYGLYEDDYELLKQQGFVPVEKKK
ncbi:nitroreductase [Anaeromyces robustus]|jgi:FMN reductase [NAD(P)H]|uniref:Nitroreductase n=1 Tax=Anaeromyces robustus TaxID=1754192 RepID=A0A1Y1VVI2_9FUNG|nr:nitroreductase [Anaeromyces robustus]|eukprot:ORX64774.1 nitroreductase [Anaeromyces robustus]